MTPDPAEKEKKAAPKPAAASQKTAKAKKFELDSKRLRLILLGSLAVAIIGFFVISFYGLSALSAKSKALVDLKVQSQTADSELSNLEQSKKEVEKYSYFKDVAKTVIPNDKDQAQAVLEINQMAEASGIAIQSIAFPTSNLGLRAATTTEAGTAPANTAITQATPVSGIPGLYSLTLIITPQSGTDVPADKQITFPKMLDFLSRIENNRHTAQITQVDIKPAAAVQTLSFSLTVNIFIKP